MRVLDMIYDPPNRNPGKPIKWIIFDSFVISCIAFLANLPVDRLPNMFDLYTALRAFSYAFFLQLAIERGLKPYLARRNNDNDNNGENDG
jgi:hypothetical protein